MRYQHIPGVTVTAQFAEGGKLRYRLEIVRPDLPVPGKTVCAVLQNPSVAGEHLADKTVQFLEKVVFLRGQPEFAGVRRLIVVNLFARVQTRGFAGRPEDIGPQNDLAIAGAMQEAEIILLGWGRSCPYRQRQEHVLRLLAGMPGKLVYHTRSHPARGRYAGFILPLRRDPPDVD